MFKISGHTVIKMIKYRGKGGVSVIGLDSIEHQSVLFDFSVSKFKSSITSIRRTFIKSSSVTPKILVFCVCHDVTFSDNSSKVMSTLLLDISSTKDTMMSDKIDFAVINI